MGYKAAYAVRTSGLEDGTLVDVLESLASFMNETTGVCFPSTKSEFTGIPVWEIRPDVYDRPEVYLAKTAKACNLENERG